MGWDDKRKISFMDDCNKREEILHMKMKKLNIALLTLGFSKERKEATGITIMSYAKELKRLGHNVIIISSKKGFRTEILREYEKVD